MFVPIIRRFLVKLFFSSNWLIIKNEKYTPIGQTIVHFKILPFENLLKIFFLKSKYIDERHPAKRQHGKNGNNK